MRFCKVSCKVTFYCCNLEGDYLQLINSFEWSSSHTVIRLTFELLSSVNSESITASYKTFLPNTFGLLWESSVAATTTANTYYPFCREPRWRWTFLTYPLIWKVSWHRRRTRVVPFFSRFEWFCVAEVVHSEFEITLDYIRTLIVFDWLNMLS